MSYPEHGFPCLSSIRFYRQSHSAGPLDCILCLFTAFVDSFKLNVQHLLRSVKDSTRERHLFFLQQCSGCLDPVNWMVLEMGGRWPYNCCFFGMLLPWLIQYGSWHSCAISVFFSMCFVSVYLVYPNCSMDTTAAWKKIILFYRVGLTSLWPIVCR